MFAGLRPTAIPILLLTANVGKGSKGAASRAAAFASTPSRKGTSHVAQAIDRHSGRASPTWDSRLPGGSSAVDTTFEFCIQTKQSRTEHANRERAMWWIWNERVLLRRDLEVRCITNEVFGLCRSEIAACRVSSPNLRCHRRGIMSRGDVLKP
jgi:hypothetical protein